MEEPQQPVTVHRMKRALRDQLIEEVRAQPVLYDTGLENHRDNEMRDKAWLDIAGKLNVNSEMLKREWKILRDSFRQALKKRKFERGKRMKRAGKEWYFESKMNFLLPFMGKRPQIVYTGGDAVVSEMKLDGFECSELPDRTEVAWRPDLAPELPDDGDGLDLFFASVTQSARRFPRRIQNELKRNVLDLLIKCEEEAEHELGFDVKISKSYGASE